MLFTIFLPYQSNMAENDDLKDYYKTEQDYIDALRTEERTNGSMIFDTMANGGIDSNSYRAFGHKEHHIPDRIAFAHAEGTLYSPNGAIPESVDSIIDKFAGQKEFLVTVNINESSMQPEFEEELNNWWDETKNILKYAKKMGDEWLDTNIPRRQMRLSFQNKSNKTVNFSMEKCEIEEKISKNRYLIYVNKLQILR